jgi:hypothetical protein
MATKEPLTFENTETRAMITGNERGRTNGSFQTKTIVTDEWYGLRGSGFAVGLPNGGAQIDAEFEVIIFNGIKITTENGATAYTPDVSRSKIPFHWAFRPSPAPQTASFPGPAGTKLFVTFEPGPDLAAH